MSMRKVLFNPKGADLIIEAILLTPLKKGFNLVFLRGNWAPPHAVGATPNAVYVLTQAVGAQPQAVGALPHAVEVPLHVVGFGLLWRQPLINRPGEAGAVL